METKTGIFETKQKTNRK